MMTGLEKVLVLFTVVVLTGGILETNLPKRLWEFFTAVIGK